MKNDPRAPNRHIVDVTQENIRSLPNRFLLRPILSYRAIHQYGCLHSDIFVNYIDVS